MPRIAVLAPEGAYATGPAAILDLFALGNRYAVGQYSAVDLVRPPSMVQVLTDRGAPCRLANGRTLTPDGAWGSDEEFDLVYVANVHIDSDEEVAKRLDLDGRLISWLSVQSKRGALLSASGASVFYLAEAGVFGDDVATAPWWLERAFKRRYPGLTLDISRIIAEGKGFTCAGSSRGEQALALRLTNRLLSANVANWLAKVTLVDPYPDGPEPWTVFSPRVLREDGLVGRAQHWLQQRFSQQVRMGDLAADLRVSTRTLERRFQRSLNMSPLDYLQRLRIEAAKHMLARSNRKVERVAYLVGYADAAFFKQLFKTEVGMSPTTYRKTNSTTFARGRD